MVEVDFGGDYLNAETSKDGDICEIMGEGAYEEKEIKGKKKKLFNLPVRLNGTKDLIYTPGAKAGKELMRAWGKDSKNWIGKKFQIKIVTVEVAGNEMDVVRPKPIAEQKA